MIYLIWTSDLSLCPFRDGRLAGNAVARVRPDHDGWRAYVYAPEPGVGGAGFGSEGEAKEWVERQLDMEGLGCDQPWREPTPLVS
jgi:hypothetical protein